MLKSLANSDIDSNLIIIQDDASSASRMVFEAFICNHSRSRIDMQINLINSEPIHMNVTASKNSIKRIDVFPTIESSILSICSEIENKAIIIDSINPFLWCNGIVKVSRELLHLSQKARKVICYVHKDTLLQADDSIQLKYISTSHINIVKRLDDDNRNARRFLVDVYHRKVDGRLDRAQREVVTLDSELNLTSSVYAPQVDTPVVRTVDMGSLTTFNLGVEMKPSEKEARDRLVLPYTKKEGGDVLYEADDADLEEDPDDDLEL